MGKKLKEVRGRFSINIILSAVGAFIVFLGLLSGGLFIMLKPYTITFDLNDGSEPFCETYDLNAGEIHLGIPRREGYRFVGWTGSNGSVPEMNVTVGNGMIGELSYTANWSEELIYTCRDWVIDREGNPVKEITSEVDAFLEEGKSAKGYAVMERTQKTAKGAVVNARAWGDDGAYKAYSSEYVFVGTSGDVQIENDETVVYRYFYPVLDVNYLVDGLSPAESEVEATEVARFDLVVDGKKVATDVSDYCKGVPAGSSYEVVVKNVNRRFMYEAYLTDSGIMGDSRNNINISFVTRPPFR
jgi:uncharacterized repeat protein (TIGR02543 family)